MNDMQPDHRSAFERRHHPRAKVLWTGSLEHGGRTSDCILLDIGVSGALARAVEAPPRPGPVTLHSFHFGRLAAEIVWSEGNAFGLQFKRSPAEVRRAIGWQLPAHGLV